MFAIMLKAGEDDVVFACDDPNFFSGDAESAKRKANSLPAICEGFAFDEWEDLGLSRPLLRALKLLRFKRPTPIQQMAIPAVLTRRDVLGCSATGSGKTGAFLLPLIEELIRDSVAQALRVVVVLPTRELAAQSLAMFQSFNTSTGLHAALAVGGAALASQEFALRRGVDVLFGTPGRLVDLCRNSQGINFANVQTLVLDEADRLLEMGFSAELEYLLEECCAPQRQTLLFSATLDKNVKKLGKTALRQPLRVEPPNAAMPLGLRHRVFRLGTANGVREAALFVVLERFCSPPALVFFKTRAQCHRAALQFAELGGSVQELTGKQLPAERQKAVKAFKEERGFLFATDLAARGLDFPELGFVVNFDLPLQSERYTHRAGRTARAGQSGVCISLLDNAELKLMRRAARRLQIELDEDRLDKGAVALMAERLAAIEGRLQSRMSEERNERMIDRTEKEAQRAANILQYSDEIMSRPRREWVLSAAQKKAIKAKDKPVFK